MAKVTNTSRGYRGINVRGNNDAHIQMMLAPGETQDVEIFDPGNPIYQAWVDMGEMDFAGGVPQAPERKPRGRPPAMPPDPSATE